MFTITEAVAAEIAERRARFEERPDRGLIEHLLVATHADAATRPSPAKRAVP